MEAAGTAQAMTKRADAAYSEGRVLRELMRLASLGHADAGVREIAERAGLSFGSARRALNRLVSDGVIRRESSGRRGCRQSLEFVPEHPRWRRYYGIDDGPWETAMCTSTNRSGSLSEAPSGTYSEAA